MNNRHYIPDEEMEENLQELRDHKAKLLQRKRKIKNKIEILKFNLINCNIKEVLSIKEELDKEEKRFNKVQKRIKEKSFMATRLSKLLYERKKYKEMKEICAKKY